MPFSTGHVFRKGDVPAGQGLALDASATQILPISTWDDGSLKHGVISGLIDLAANTPRTLTISIASVAAATPLNESNLIALNPSASVSYGSYGTVNLSALLGTSARVLTEQAGPYYASFQYMSSFSGDSSLRAVFHVQLWSNGRYRVRVVVENGSAPFNASGSKSGAATVSIAGNQRFSGAVSMPQGTRWDVVGFNGADPVITPSINVNYLLATKLVPNYGWRAPSQSTLNGVLSNYTPMARLEWEQDMGAVGYAPSIGLLPHWDALFCVTSDARAYNSCIAHGRSYGTYSIFYRDPNTRRLPLMADYPTAYINDERMAGNGTNNNQWEFAHHPNAGYLPWLITAERFFLEVIEANSWAAYVTNSVNGAGTSRLFVSQTRGRAWRYRTHAALAAVAPDSDLLKTDRRNNVVANLKNWQSAHVAPNTPATGLVGIYDDKDGGAAGFQHSIFESLFMVAAIGWSWDQEMKLSAADRASHQAVRDFAYRLPVGLAGRGPALNEFSWRRAPGPYRMLIGSSSSTSSLYNTFKEIYQATYGDNLDSSAGLTILEAYADDSSAAAFPQGNWGHMITALAFAVDHGATGAAAGYARITGASNWASNSMKFNEFPQYGVKARG
ncbi:MAG: hypothetical protein AB7K41_11490 [Bdellovibrionales bacterium]